MQFNFRTVRSDNALLDICGKFTEWVEPYRNYGLVPGISVDEKEYQTYTVLH